MAMHGLKPVRNRRQDALARTKWADVERLLADHFRRAGYSVEHCGTGESGTRFDGGIDLKLRRGEAYILVQCKHWNAMKVPHNDVLQLIGAMVNEMATGAVLVTSGEFTKAAIEAATRHGHVQLIDGDELREMLGSIAQPNAVSATSTSRLKQELIRLVLVIVVALIAFFWIRSAILDFQRTMTRHAQSSQAPRKPGVDSVPPAPPSSVHAPPAAQAKPMPGHKPTPEEIRESRRRAEESMKILEATTPEL